MDEMNFWQLIAEAKREAGNDTEIEAQLLEQRLIHFTEADIIAFERIFCQQMLRAYEWDLWGAAYIINGGCSDDGFVYFRGWLIAQGQQVFEDALRDPKTLIDAIVLESGWDADCEDMRMVARLAYEAKTGQEMPDEYFINYENGEPAGTPWISDEELYEKYAALFARANLRWDGYH